MEKIKLFAKKNEEKKDNRTLFKKIGDWCNDEENLPLVTYGCLSFLRSSLQTV